MSNGQDVHFILTGGESLLGWQRFYVDLFEHPNEGFEKCYFQNKYNADFTQGF